MNSLSVQNVSLIGSNDDILALKKKRSARLLVVSDSHGETEVLSRIICDFGCDCDVLVFCGDGICDVTAFLNEAIRDDKLAEMLPPVVACARGNGDAEQYPVDACVEEMDNETKQPVQRYFNVQPMVMFNVAGRTVLCVHGNRHGVDFGTDTLVASAEALDADFVFFGHTHRICREEAGATLILNPGSCSRPRGGLPPTFAVVSFPGATERYDVEFFEINETLFGGYTFTPFHA